MEFNLEDLIKEETEPRNIMTNFEIPELSPEEKRGLENWEIIKRKYYQIADLTSQLESSHSDVGDWKIIKCYEAKLNENEMPYDVNDLMAKRSEIRRQINALQNEIEELEQQS